MSLGSLLRSFVLRFRAMARVLSNQYPSQKILNFSRNAQNIDVENEIVTLMFVDVSGFSYIADHQTPTQTFEIIKPILQTIITVVTKHGGTVDKTMGDGVFAYFRDTSDEYSILSQADKALNCAVEIQRTSMNHLFATAEELPIMPLRIGINTASVCLGRLRTEHFFEIPVIGRGVNFAQRLEQACDIYSVMASESTLELATLYNPTTPGVSRKIIKPKYHAEVLTVFELDPFHETPLLREKAIEKYRHFRKLQRQQERISVPDISPLIFQSNFGDVRILDFSTGGLSIELEKYLAKNVSFSIALTPKHRQLSEELAAHGIDSLLIEVKWGKVSDNHYLHGVQYLNLSERQKEFIFHCMADYVHEKPAHLKKMVM